MVSGTYLRNAWYVAAWSDDLGDGQLLGRTILKETIVLYRKSDGNVAALARSLSASVRAVAYGKDRPWRSRPVSLSWAGIQFVGRLRLESSRNKKHSPARSCPQLSGDREAQGDLDLDG